MRTTHTNTVCFTNARQQHEMIQASLTTCKATWIRPSTCIGSDHGTNTQRHYVGAAAGLWEATQAVGEAPQSHNAVASFPAAGPPINCIAVICMIHVSLEAACDDLGLSSNHTDKREGPCSPYSHVYSVGSVPPSGKAICGFAPSYSASRSAVRL